MRAHPAADLGGREPRDAEQRERQRDGTRRVDPAADEAARPDLTVGVCGEHGGDPDSIHFFESVSLDYVSCSPFRVPVARLEAGRAAILRGSGVASDSR